jgi:alkaline phosphatase
MSYVDGFVLVVPRKNLKAYKVMAAMAGKLWKKHGALQYFECMGDDLKPEWCKVPFPKMAKARKNDTVWYSFIIYKSKADRKRVNAKVMKDPAMQNPAWKDKPMPFDMNRMAYGGFQVVVER